MARLDLQAQYRIAELLGVEVDIDFVDEKGIFSIIDLIVIDCRHKCRILSPV